MRRSVLVVICDFLVLAALSLIGGGSGDFTGGSFLPVPGAQAAAADTASDWAFEEQEQEWEDLYGTFDEFLLEESEKKTEEALQETTDALAEAARLLEEKKAAEARAKLVEEQLKKKQKEAAEAKSEAELARAAAAAAQTDAKKAGTQAELARAQAGQARTLMTEAQKQAALAAAARELADVRAVQADTLLKQRQKEADQARAAAARVQQTAIKLATEKAVLEKERSLARAQAERTQDQLAQKDKEIENIKKSGAAAVAQVTLLKEDRERILKDAKTAASTLQTTTRQLDDAQRKLDTMQKQVAALTAQIKENERRKFVAWSKPKAWRKLTVHMRERDMITVAVFKAALSLPVLRVDGKCYAVGEFHSIGLGWSNVVKDGRMMDVDFSFAVSDDPKQAIRITRIHTLEGAPGLCLIPIPDEQAKELNVYEPLGMEGIMKRQDLSGMYRFNKDNPDDNSEVAVGLGVSGNFLVVKDSKYVYTLPRYTVARGDYLISKMGEFIGVMVSDTKCRVFPTKPKLAGASVAVPAADARRDKNGLLITTFPADAKKIYRTLAPEKK